MPKQVGDKKAERGKSVNELVSSFTYDLAKRDEKYERFNAWKPFPQQTYFFQSEKKVKFAVGGNRCLGENTKIYDPVKKLYIPIHAIKDFDDFHVYAWDESCKKRVIAEACTPFVKCLEDIYEVKLSNGNSFEATLRHLLLCEDRAYRSVYECFRKNIELHSSSLDSTRITEVKILRKHSRVWDFTVPFYHNYFCEGIVHHNSGKTTIGLIEDIIVYTGIIPESLKGIYPHRIPKRPRLVRIITMNYTKHWPETIKPFLDQHLPEEWQNEFDEDEHIYYGPDGSKLSIMAIDPKEDIDPQILRAANVDHTHIDEINNEICYSESLTRAAALPDGPKTLTLTYCPQNGQKSWEYGRLWKKVFNAVTKKYLPLSERDPNIFGLRLTMKDNPLITEVERNKIIAGLRDWEIPFRVDGEYSDKTDRPYFKMESLLDWDDTCQTIADGVMVKLNVTKYDAERGIFDSDLQMVSRSEMNEYEPAWEVWEAPKNNEKYVMACDVAEGNLDSDFSVADIYRCTNPDLPVQVAKMRKRMVKPGEFAIQCGCMAHFFGDCLVVPEVNNTAGGILIDRLRNYKNLYTRMGAADKRHTTETEKLGWRTDGATKPLALETLYKFLIETHSSGYCFIRSRQSLYELMSFEERIIKDKYGRFNKIEYCAKNGEFDDSVATMWIAIRVIRAEFYKITKAKLEKSFCEKDIDLPDWQFSIEPEKRKNRLFSVLKPVKRLHELQRQSSGGRRLNGIYAGRER